MPVPNSSRCKSCQSDKESTFNGEVALHFPGLEGLHRPTVLVFPKITVCLDCGFSEFNVSQPQLKVLETGESV